MKGIEPGSQVRRDLCNVGWKSSTFNLKGKWEGKKRAEEEEEEGR